MSPMNENDEVAQQQFLETLRVYHERRGTHFDSNPRVGAKSINLLRLFNVVVARGGYDAVSDEKLLWRKIGAEFDLGANNAPALAFSLKTLYYRNLAAYEIQTVYNKEPPPKEILEFTTAKGSGLLTRTLENFRPSTRRETNTLGNESEASGDEGTPVRESNGNEDMHGSGGRATRGLRQAPPQRVLFQPETQSTRQHRNTSGTSHMVQTQHHQQNQHQQAQHQHHGPPRGASTSYNPSTNMDNMSLSVTNYEPRPQMPLTLRPVITPGNNPGEFARRQRALAFANANGKPATATPKQILPGTGFDGPNIYVRCLCALKSGIPSEQDYALHHLVKISMERGDKYRFESFPGLAEALIEKLLEVSSLFYKVDWDISYMDDGLPSANTIDGLEGSLDIMKKVSRFTKLPVNDSIQDAEFSDALLQINEAGLTMRNMVMLEENAYYVSEMYPLRAFLSIALNLPNLDCLVELKHYALDISEQITKYMSFSEVDPLYSSLLEQLQSQDRGAILTALRAISRISMNLEENNLLTGVPAQSVQNIIDWILLNDEELGHACLDFLYQYTAVVKNVDLLLTHLQIDSLVNQLTRLLTHNGKALEKEMALGRETIVAAPQEIARLPQELLAQLNNLNEPERSSQWLRSLFEEDPNESITQIALWQAYQARFTPVNPETGRGLLPAAEFIKNVSSTFGDKATAQVQPGAVQKFIIKGIRMRHTPVDFKGEEYKKCLWRTPSRQGPYSSAGIVCGEFFMSPEQMYQHILTYHIGATQREDGKFDNSEILNRPDDPAKTSCYWDTCRRFKSVDPTNMAQLAAHVKVHLPAPPATASADSVEHVAPPAKRQKLTYIKSPPRQPFKWRSTATDENGNAAGIPLSAVLVLRNLARNIPKTQTDDSVLKKGGVSWVQRLFKPVEPYLFEVMAHNNNGRSNRSLTFYVADLIGTIKESELDR